MSSAGSVFGFWSAKGGVGVSTIAALSSIGLSSAVTRDAPVFIVDLVGDLAAVFGVETKSDVGVAEWSRSSEPTVAALSRIATPVAQNLSFIARGRGNFGLPPAQLVASVASLAGSIGGQEADSFGVAVLDAGSFDQSLLAAKCNCADHQYRFEVLEHVDADILITRNCYLALRNAKFLGRKPAGVILASERSKALGAGDVEVVVGADVIAEIEIDSRISRSVDAGLICARVPKKLTSVLAQSLQETRAGSPGSRNIGTKAA